MSRWYGFLAVLLLLARPAQAEPVDVLLVLTADVSRSVDDVEFEIQRGGYARAFTESAVLEAIRNGPRQKIAVAYVEWSGELEQQVLVDWMVISDAASGKAFGDKILATPRPFRNRTGLGIAIDHATKLLARSPYTAPRKVIDVSGDGTNTNGPGPTISRDAAIAAGITINALVILSAEPLPWNPHHTHPPGGLREYFRQNVIGGQDSFTEVVADWRDFAAALRHKLLREIAAAPTADGPQIASSWDFLEAN